MLLTSIRTAITDRWTEDVDIAKLNRMIDAAVRYYSRWNPLVSELEVQAVANEKLYDMPGLGAVDCIGIKEVLWQPLGTQYSTPPPPRALLSHQVIDDIEQSARLARVGGSYDYEPARRYLTIYPRPVTGGETFLVRYYAQHVLVDSGYPTIPDGDLELLAGVVIADLLDQQGFAAAGSPDYKEGLESVSVKNVAEASLLRASELRGRVALKYGANSVLSAP